MSPLAAEHDSFVEDRLAILGFVRLLRYRWRSTALACAVALALTLVGSLLMERKYTATASLLIEPPAGNDPRGATAISPIYLESLKTYEIFAESDTLFARALDNLHLREKQSGPIESVKKRVLRVTKPRDTKILEVSVTLPNPRDAQALARYLANETVQLNSALDRQSQQDLTTQVRQQSQAAATRLRNADRARDEFLASDPIEPLESDVRNANERKFRLENELTEARVDLVDYEARLQSRSGADQDPRETSNMKEQLIASRARTAGIEKEGRSLAEVLKTKGATLEVRKHRREVLDVERQSARAQYESAAIRENDTLASAAFRSERLEIVDPGTVPERPSSPNLVLNCAVALIASFFGSGFYLALQYSRSQLNEPAGGRKDRFAR